MALSRVLLMLLLFSATVAVTAQKYSPDHQAIRNNEFDWEKAWNSHDMKALAARVAADVQYVTIMGDLLEGRDAFAKYFAGRHAVQLKNSKYSTSDDDIDVDFITADVAVAHVRWNMSGVLGADGKAQPPGKGIATRFYVKRDGEWVIRASHSSLMPAAQTATILDKKSGML